MRHWLVLILFLLGLGTLRVVACGEEGVDRQSCVRDEDCDDGNPCTRGRCYDADPFPITCEVVDGYCLHLARRLGTPCGRGKVCIDGVCVENLCEGVAGNAIFIEDECVPTDCDGLDDGTECIFFHPGGHSPGFCEAGYCNRPGV